MATSHRLPFLFLPFWAASVSLAPEAGAQVSPRVPVDDPPSARAKVPAAAPAAEDALSPKQGPAERPVYPHGRAGVGGGMGFGQSTGGEGVFFLGAGRLGAQLSAPLGIMWEPALRILFNTGVAFSLDNNVVVESQWDRFVLAGGLGFAFAGYGGTGEPASLDVGFAAPSAVLRVGWAVGPERPHERWMLSLEARAIFGTQQQRMTTVGLGLSWDTK